MTCTDDGSYTLTLTASDGVNPDVLDTATLELANLAPTVDISAPGAGSSMASAGSASARRSPMPAPTTR